MMLSDINTVCEQYAYRLIDTVDRSDADGGPTADDVALLLKEVEERFGVAGIVLTVTYLARKAAAGFAVIAHHDGSGSAAGADLPVPRRDVKRPKKN